MIKKTTKGISKRPKNTDSDSCLWISEVTLQELKENPLTLQLFCRRIRMHAYLKEARDVDHFAWKYKIQPSKLQRWRHDLPELDAAMKEYTEVVHVNRRTLWGDGKLREANFLRYAWHQEEEKKNDEYHDARTKDRNDNVRELTQGVIREILQEFNYDKEKKDEDSTIK